jgi:hypothetical protein
MATCDGLGFTGGSGTFVSATNELISRGSQMVKRPLCRIRSAT